MSNQHLLFFPNTSLSQKGFASKNAFAKNLLHFKITNGNTTLQNKEIFRANLTLLTQKIVESDQSVLQQRKWHHRIFNEAQEVWEEFNPAKDQPSNDQFASGELKSNEPITILEEKNDSDNADDDMSDDETVQIIIHDTIVVDAPIVDIDSDSSEDEIDTSPVKKRKIHYIY